MKTQLDDYIQEFTRKNVNDKEIIENTLGTINECIK